MSSSNPFITYQCNTCRRFIEFSLDPRRPDPHRCVITNKCSGIMLRVASSLTKKFLFTPSKLGLQDYIQRGIIQLNEGTAVQDNYVSLLTSETKDALTLYSDSVESSIAVTCSKISNTNDFEFKRYIYSKSGNFSFISGPDDSPIPVNLQFKLPPTQKIEVYVNGIIQTAGRDYILNDSLDTDQEKYRYKVIFKKTYPAIKNIVEILVYNEVDLANIDPNSNKVLTFYRYDDINHDIKSNREFLSWGNCNTITHPSLFSGAKTIYYCLNINSLDNDVEYLVRNSHNFLLSRPPHGFQDRELNLVLNTANDSVRVIKTQNINDGRIELYVKASNLTELIQPFKLTLDNSINQASVLGTSIKSDTIIKQYVIGPT